MSQQHLSLESRIWAVQRSWNPFAEIALPEAACWQGGEGALGGIAVSVKDIVDVAGFATRWGSKTLADAPAADRDAVAVARLRAAGARIVAKTTTTEFAHSPLGYAPLTGMTLNPWNPARTCGGSSSGAGVAVATGATPVSLTTDAGCSTRLPAALTGTFGLKPTLGRIPHERVPEAFANIVHLGIIAASVDMLERTLAVLAGADANDPFSLGHAAYQRSDDAHVPGGCRILLWMKAGNQAVDPEVFTATMGAADLFRKAGAHVEVAEYDLLSPDPCWQMLQQTSWAGRLSRLPVEQRALLSASLNRGADVGASAKATDLAAALAQRTAFFRAVQKVFAGGYDYILTPCASAPAVAADHPVDAPLEIGGRSMGGLRSEWIPYLSLFDLSGHPALAMPACLDGNGVPMGVQLVAPWGREDRLLAAARAWTRICPPPVLKA